MKSDEIYRIIIKYVIEVTNLEEKKIPLDKSLLEEGLLDSFGIVELIDFLENKFSIRIQDSEITKENLGSINKMTIFVEKRIIEV